MLYTNNYIYKDTLIHRIHPVIKFILFLLIIFLLFLKISIFIHLSIFLITLWVAYSSKNLYLLYKKTFRLYFGLFFFLFLVQWVFNKNPGFWYSHNIQENYVNLFNFFSKKNTYSTSNDSVMHGWFIGGDLVMENGNIKLHDSAKELASAKNVFSVVLDKQGALKYVGFNPKWYTLTLMQPLAAFNITNKLIIAVILTSLLTMTTSFSDLSYALQDLFSVLRIFKLPTNEMALIVAISIRFTPSLVQESLRIIKAQASRGIDFKNGKKEDKCAALLSLFVPLFVISFIKADELSSAMIARAYRPMTNRTSYKMHQLNAFHVIGFSLFVIFIAGLYHLHFQNVYCGWFGKPEFLLLVAK